MASLSGALSFTIACVTTIWLASVPSSIIDTERPVHLLNSTLICSVIILSLVRRYAPTHQNNATSDYTTLPLQELEDNRYGLEDKPSLKYGRSQGSRRNVITILLAGIILTIRIEIQRRIFLESECTTRSIEVFLPLIISVYDALFIQRSRDFIVEEKVDSTAYEDLVQTIKSKWLSHRWRYVPAAFLLSFGCYLVGGLWLNSQSNVICPLIGSARTTIPRLQLLALFLDALMVIAASQFAPKPSRTTRGERHIPTGWLVVLISPLTVWTAISIVIYRTQPENRAWLLFTNEASPVRSMLKLFISSILLGLTGVIILLSLSHVGILHAVMALTAISTIVPGFRFIWSANRPYPPISSANLTWSFVFIYTAWSFHSRIRRSVESIEPSPSRTRRILIFLTFLILIFPGLNKTNSVHFHPIDLLMYNAQKEYTSYLNIAARSTSLKDAVQNYQTRYHENPPPGFDIWFEFARNRSVWVTDEFDQIHNDLLPFRSVSPADIRRQTWEDISNPWNEIGGISIRNGQAHVQENDLHTHRWMLDGAVKMIETFSQYLPDMDLAFNLNDEPRIALKHDRLQSILRIVSNIKFDGSLTWSANRALGWRDPPLEPTSDTVFENWSFQKTYLEWGAAGCPSILPQTLKPLYRSQICATCVGKHSLGQFVANWSLSADPCHQPDLAYLHGHYLSPAAFKPTHQLRPVFSQSKAHGYNDILYPSPWNYLDKVAYAPRNASGTPGTDDYVVGFADPPFAEKQNLLYWRGATSEGVSDGHEAWRGMTRQRMIHMADNSSNSVHDRVVLLLPDQRHPERLTYTSVSGTAIPQLGLSSSVQFVDGIARCGGKDCYDQEQEFASALPADFQAHWQYKYLMDMDGAGFSGRFLAFLQSRSLPFKSALFREWYDSRLIPWLHFVPQDIRLNGLWSTLAYFEGVQGSDEQGRKWDWQGHQREAIVIAEGGREWAEKALTKADMEVYMFRLLLEWARLTDDNRERLGYKLES